MSSNSSSKVLSEGWSTSQQYAVSRDGETGNRISTAQPELSFTNTACYILKYIHEYKSMADLINQTLTETFQLSSKYIQLLLGNKIHGTIKRLKETVMDS